jgi:tetratricopeptide (TPR) repeat protein
MLSPMKLLLRAVLVTIAVSGCSSMQGVPDDRLTAAIAAENRLKNTRPSADERGAVIALYSEVIDAGDTNVASRNEALFRRGRLYAEASDCARAMDDIDRAINAGLRASGAHMILANCHRKAGLLDEARKDVDRAIVVNGNEPLLYRARAMISMDQKRYDAAAQDLSKSIDLVKPDESSDLFEMRGDAYLAAAQYENAVDDYESAIRVSNRDAVRIMGSASRRSAQLAPIYEKLSKAYAGLARESERGRPN